MSVALADAQIALGQKRVVDGNELADLSKRYLGVKENLRRLGRRYDAAVLQELMFLPPVTTDAHEVSELLKHVSRPAPGPPPLPAGGTRTRAERSLIVCKLDRLECAPVVAGG